MAQPQWEVQRPVGTCARTGKAIQEGEDFYSALFEDGDGFRREDYCLSGWEGPPDGAFCHFKTRLPVRGKRKKTFVDSEVLRAFFVRLADETEPVRLRFRFVIALILMQKRILKYERSIVEGGVEIWEMHLTRDDAVHRVVNPQLTEDQIDEVGQQLGQILHTDMGTWDDEALREEGMDEGTMDSES